MGTGVVAVVVVVAVVDWRSPPPHHSGPSTCVDSAPRSSVEVFAVGDRDHPDADAAWNE